MGKELKVLMMGGQRVGKSSALAAVMDSFINGSVKSILTAKDKTSLARIDGERQASIKSKLDEVKTMLIQHDKKNILVDSGKTSKIWHYKLELAVAGCDDSMTMVFTDINGEFFDGGSIHQDEIISLVEEYDVFIVAIDTPFMMEARKKQLVNPIINNKYNCIDSIHTFLTQINDKDGANAKLVLFTPIKCEKWAKENKLEEVTQAVLEDYTTTIKALVRYKSVQIEVIPIQTAGSIVFVAHSEAFVFNWKKSFLLFFVKEYSSKCALLPNNMVRLADGTEVHLNSGKVTDDMSAVLIHGTDIIRPNSWYKVLSTNYEPHNCEQLAFHALDFMLSKVVDAEIRNREGNIFRRAFVKLLSMLNGIFGGITIEKMHDILNKIKEYGFLKDSGEGIYILKKCNFKKLNQ